ncbi:MAG: hypothetical protein G01um101433_613 [Parcubacteria group bacterium Gr01-1014_33]|nr:MAG: hypothetical protein G01um101433_613 [Parcubacteria group bacterium Gr01-1014_33]
MKLFIWDFHGTLEKGNEHAVREITNRVLEEKGYNRSIDEKTNHHLYGKKWYEYFVHVLPEESEETHLQLQERCIAFQVEHPDIVPRHIRPNDHAKETLAEIRKKHDQIIISHTPQKWLDMFIRVTGLMEFFPAGKCFGIDAHQPNFTRSKEEIAEEYLADKEFEKIIVIGDSPHDMIPLENCARYLYAHEDKPFKECDADYRIRDLREILREV